MERILSFFADKDILRKSKYKGMRIRGIIEDGEVIVLYTMDGDFLILSDDPGIFYGAVDNYIMETPGTTFPEGNFVTLRRELDEETRISGFIVPERLSRITALNEVADIESGLFSPELLLFDLGWGDNEADLEVKARGGFAYLLFNYFGRIGEPPPLKGGEIFTLYYKKFPFIPQMLKVSDLLPDGFFHDTPQGHATYDYTIDDLYKNWFVVSLYYAPVNSIDPKKRPGFVLFGYASPGSQDILDREARSLGLSVSVESYDGLNIFIARGSSHEGYFSKETPQGHATLDYANGNEKAWCYVDGVLLLGDNIDYLLMVARELKDGTGFDYHRLGYGSNLEVKPDLLWDAMSRFPTYFNDLFAVSPSGGNYISEDILFIEGLKASPLISAVLGLDGRGIGLSVNIELEDLD